MARRADFAAGLRALALIGFKLGFGDHLFDDSVIEAARRKVCVDLPVAFARFERSPARNLTRDRSPRAVSLAFRR